MNRVYQSDYNWIKRGLKVFYGYVSTIFLTYESRAKDV